MDIFAEQIVKKKSTGKTVALKALIIAGVVILSAGCLFLMLCGLGIAFFLGVGIVYGGYYLLSGMDCEYEYIVTNGEIDVDKIIAKRKRKRLITAKAPLFERFGKLCDAPEPDSDATIVLAEGDGNGEENYYADFTHASVGNVRLIFTPESKIIEAVRPFLPRNTRVEFDRTYGAAIPSSNNE